MAFAAAAQFETMTSPRWLASRHRQHDSTNPFRQDVTAARPSEMPGTPFSTSIKPGLECQKKIYYFLTHENDCDISS